MGYIIGLNMLFGLIGGWLFYKKGLEAAILAHMMAHVVMLMAS
ncbi:MAG: CPBP family intramembrane metalloprotease, partial [Algicola sp.]|nr:CPBP family intramembrane metalloprotease [Algicola sp.]